MGKRNLFVREERGDGSLNKAQGRDLMIQKICWAVLKKRLAQMKSYADALRRLPDDELLQEYKRRVK